MLLTFKNYIVTADDHDFVLIFLFEDSNNKRISQTFRLNRTVWGPREAAMLSRVDVLLFTMGVKKNENLPSVCNRSKGKQFNFCEHGTKYLTGPTLT